MNLPSQLEEVKWYHKVAAVTAWRSLIVTAALAYMWGSSLMTLPSMLVQHKLPSGLTDFWTIMSLSLIINIRVGDLFESTILDYLTVLPAVLFLLGLVQHNVWMTGFSMLSVSLFITLSLCLLIAFRLFGHVTPPPPTE